MRFEFATATRIVFGPGTLKEAGPLARSLGSRALVVTGKSTGRAATFLDQLKSSHVAVELFSIPSEPTLALVESGVAQARGTGCDCVISFGGGSAIDAGKAMAGLLANPGPVLDYVEVIGQGRPLTRAPLPFMAIPTTAGTGAEVTRNAVLASPEHRVKASLRSPLLLARVALVDSELTLGLPPSTTANTGLDALTQVIEPYVCVRANPMTDAFCVEGMRRVARSLRRAWRDGSDAQARDDMALASLLGGLALANAGLGAVHGLAAPIGGMFSTPHGAVCAALLPAVMETNLEALRARDPKSPVLGRYQEVGQILTGRLQATAEDGVHWVRELCREFAISPLAHWGIDQADHEALANKAAEASSMKANPVVLNHEEITEVLARS